MLGRVLGWGAFGGWLGFLPETTIRALVMGYPPANRGGNLRRSPSSPPVQLVRRSDRFWGAARLVVGHAALPRGRNFSPALGGRFHRRSQLLVEGRARTARAAARDDWAAGDAGVDVRDLDAPTRAALGQHWRSIAALEHASVASFARFTLHVLALGAPPTLVAAAQRAGLDEVEHARLAYGLAGAYGGAPVGPAPLDLTGVDFTTARGDVQRALIHEACVGETLAAAEAGALAARVRDPALRHLHARIAADEQRHAELGWRALAWMLGSEDAAGVDHAERCFEEAMASARRRPASVLLTAPEHGLVSEHELAAIHAQALREVVAPCMAAALPLLSSVEPRLTSSQGACAARTTRRGSSGRPRDLAFGSAGATRAREGLRVAGSAWVGLPSAVLPSSSSSARAPRTT